jgi:hypothetical protein
MGGEVLKESKYETKSIIIIKTQKNIGSIGSKYIIAYEY